ncbi:hypothetical protein ACHAXR_002653 [Thalassiosira sp. AJA248-18]
MTKEEAINWCMNDWPRMQCVYVSHFVGSLFCLPSILGIGDPTVASSLAICGIRSEIGWEAQDTAEMLFVRTFYKNGKAIWPDAIIFITLLHHSLTSVLGVPMIMYYRNNITLHLLCFDLQFAALDDLFAPSSSAAAPISLGDIVDTSSSASDTQQTSSMAAPLV